MVRDRTDLLRRALDATNNLTVVTDATADDNPLVLVNDHFLQIMGYTREEVVGQNCRFLQMRPDGTRDDDQDAVRELVRAVAAGESTTVILRNYRKDGTLFYNELYITPIHDRDGRVVNFVGVQNDVTDRVLAQREALGRDALLRAFFDSAPTIMGVVRRDDAGLIHRMANAAAAVLYGRAPGEVAGARPSELGFTDREADRWDAAVAECAATGSPVEFETLHPWDAEPSLDGVRHFRVVMSPVEDDKLQGDLLSYLREDVTLTRQGEEERRLLAAAIDQAPEAILVTGPLVDPPGPEIVYANRAHGRIFGYSPDEVVGRTPRMFQGPETERLVLDRVRQSMEAGEPFSGETTNYRKDGSTFVLEWEIAPVRGADGRIRNWVGTQRDVTEQRRLEREVLEVQVREQERMARDLHDGLGQVLSGSAFMIEAVLGELARRGDDALAERLSRAVAHVRDGHRQARAIARGLFPVDIEADGLAPALQQLAADASTAFEVDVAFTAEATVAVRSREAAGHLYQIAREAIANAVRHGRADSVVVTLSSEADGRATLTVQDDGVGIPEPTLGAGGTGQDGPHQAGLGLRTMQHRASRVGGTLAIRPAEGGGTLVTVTFDAAEPVPPPAD